MHDQSTCVHKKLRSYPACTHTDRQKGHVCCTQTTLPSRYTIPSLFTGMSVVLIIDRFVSGNLLLQSSYFNKDLNGATRPAVPEETDNLISDYLGDLDITDKNCVLKTFNGGSAFPVLSASCALSYTLQAVCQGALQAYMSSTC